MSLSSGLHGTTFGAVPFVLLWLASCGSDANSIIHSAGGTGGAGAGAASVGGTVNLGGGSGGAAAGAGGAAAAGTGGSNAGPSGGAGAAGNGGTAGSAGAAVNGGAGGSGGAAGNGGTAGNGGAGSCAPVEVAAMSMLSRTNWSAQWSEPCNFMTGNPGCNTLTPSHGLDGKGDTRTSLGDTHLKNGNKFAQVVGDAYTFDMKACNKIGQIVMFAAAPPGNSGSFDARDFPGSLKVMVSSDCSTDADGKITGTFGDTVATASEPKPGCQNDCTLPMTINITPPVTAKCVKLELTKVLQLGASQPGIWWAIDELQVFAP